MGKVGNQEYTFAVLAVMTMRTLLEFRIAQIKIPVG